MMHLDSIWGLSFFLSLSVGWTKAQESNFTRPVFNCGGDLVDSSGFVGSEGFPNPYKPNTRCTWHITVPEGNVITFTFRLFDLEADSQCRYDYLNVYNGNSILAEKLGRFCGPFRPGALISTTNVLTLEMASDESGQGLGFLAWFNAVKPYSTDCGGRFTKAQGEIMTPNWPDKEYPPATSCSWLITVEPDMVIHVKFIKFVLESDPNNCRFDYVAFFNGGERNDSRLIGRYCGDQVPQPIITSGNVLLVQFVSDLSLTFDGFLAYYTSVPQGSQVLTVDSGSSTRSVPENPKLRPAAPERPATTVQSPVPTNKYMPPAPPEPTVRPVPVLPTRNRGQGTTNQNRNVSVTGINRKRPVSQNVLCAQVCKREGSINTRFCASEFVITGKVTSLTPGPRGTLNVNVSLLRAYKAGRLTITQVGETMSVKLVSLCKKCPLFRKGGSYVIMGRRVDEDGRGNLDPSSFTAIYKPPHHRLLTVILNKPCPSQGT